MLRTYPCGGCRRRTTHYFKKAEKSGIESNQIVLWFRCGKCGHWYTIMKYVAEAQVGPIEQRDWIDADRYKPETVP